MALILLTATQRAAYLQLLQQASRSWGDSSLTPVYAGFVSAAQLAVARPSIEAAEAEREVMIALAAYEANAWRAAAASEQVKMHTAESTLYRLSANGMIRSSVGEQTQQQYDAAQQARDDALAKQAKSDADITA